MRLSTKGRYGMRFMLDLALHYGEGPVPLNGIAQRQGISEKYLWNLIGPLKTAGLIRSVRGSHGGYVIAKSPSEINLKDVIYALEGQLCLVGCVDDHLLCERTSICITRDVWGEVSDKIQQVLEAITLKNMVDRQKSKQMSPRYEI